jgi:hypothetical protein
MTNIRKSYVKAPVTKFVDGLQVNGTISSMEARALNEWGG